MTDPQKIAQATLKIHIAVQEILEEVLQREPEPHEVGQAVAMTYGEQAAFMTAALNGDISVLDTLEAIAKQAFTDIAGPKTIKKLDAL